MSVQHRGTGICFVTKPVFTELLGPHPTPKLEDHPLLAVCDRLCNIFVPTLHVGGHSSIRNLRTRHAVVTGTYLPCRWYIY